MESKYFNVFATSPELRRVLSTSVHARVAFMAAEQAGKTFAECLEAALVYVVGALDKITNAYVDERIRAPKIQLDILPPTEERMQRFAKAAEEAIEAQGLLRKAGYGWSGLSLLETVKLVVAEKDVERAIVGGEQLNDELGKFVLQEVVNDVAKEMGLTAEQTPKVVIGTAIDTQTGWKVCRVLFERLTFKDLAWKKPSDEDAETMRMFREKMRAFSPEAMGEPTRDDFHEPNPDYVPPYGFACKHCGDILGFRMLTRACPARAGAAVDRGFDAIRPKFAVNDLAYCKNPEGYTILVRVVENVTCPEVVGRRWSVKDTSSDECWEAMEADMLTPDEYQRKLERVAIVSIRQPSPGEKKKLDAAIAAANLTGKFQVMPTMTAIAGEDIGTPGQTGIPVYIGADGKAYNAIPEDGRKYHNAVPSHFVANQQNADVLNESLAPDGADEPTILTEDPSHD